MPDFLSFLLRQYDIGVSVDKLCDLQAQFRLPHAASDIGKLHWHFIVEGSVKLHVPAKAPQVLTAHSIVFLPYSASHSLENVETKSAAANNILCGSLSLPADASVFFGSLPSYFHLQNQRQNRENPYCQLLAASAHVLLSERNYQNQGARLGSAGVIEQLIKTLFILSLRQHLEQKDEHSGALLALMTPRLDKAMRAMFANPQHNFSVEELAALANMSRASFARHFKETTGSSPLQMLLNIRMSIAANKLSQPKCHIGSLCFDLGYASQSSFHKAFCRYFGQTPGEYRQSAQDLGSD